MFTRTITMLVLMTAFFYAKGQTPSPVEEFTFSPTSMTDSSTFTTNEFTPSPTKSVEFTGVPSSSPTSSFDDRDLPLSSSSPTSSFDDRDLPLSSSSPTSDENISDDVSSASRTCSMWWK